RPTGHATSEEPERREEERRGEERRGERRRGGGRVPKSSTSSKKGYGGALASPQRRTLAVERFGLCRLLSGSDPARVAAVMMRSRRGQIATEPSHGRRTYGQTLR